jgi:caffeoyl-CoA O-methyltransferase
MINEVESRLQRDGRLGVNIGLEEGLILKSLCSLPHINKVVEIGTQYGCSALWMAMGLSDQAVIHCFEQDPQCIENAQKTFDNASSQLSPQFHLYQGPAQDNLPLVDAQGPFDLIFIDANKSGYFNYWSWAETRIAEGGIILVDNIYLFGSMFSEQCPDKVPTKMWTSVKATIDKATQHPDFATSFFPTTEGLMMSVRKTCRL